MGARVVIRPDEELDNADWTKSTWTLIGIDSIEELLKWLKMKGMSVEQFKQLPVYRNNVGHLEWLRRL